MALKPRPIPKLHHSTSSLIQGSKPSIAQKAVYSSSSDSDDLKILGIRTWRGKAVFTKPAAERKSPPTKPASSVDDLANQLIDLTVSPSPNKSRQDLSRPRGIPQFASPCARTAFSPTKKTGKRAATSKPIHPFFQQRSADRDTSKPEQRFVAKGSTAYRKPQPARQPSTGNNPLLPPPGSPTFSSASGESTPIRRPPASQRPRLAPPSSSSSSGSPSSASSSFDPASFRFRSPSPSKPPVREPVKSNESPRISPLRVISPTVRPTKPSAGQKFFKPTVNPSEPRVPTAYPKQADPNRPANQSPWKWTKWGWTQERPKSPTLNFRVAAKPAKTTAGKKATVSTIDPLVASMQNLGPEKTAFEGDSDRAEAQTCAAPQSTVHPPTDTARASPPLAVPLRPFSHKTYHIGHPLVTKPPTLAYTADPNEANELLCMIRGEAIAFDMEWPFSRGKYPTIGKTALIQVGDDRLVILIHLSMMNSEYPYFKTSTKAYSTCV